MATAEVMTGLPEQMHVATKPCPPSQELQATELQRAEPLYGPDQFTLASWVACALLIIGINIYDLIAGICGW